MIIKISDPKGEKSFFIRKLFGFSAVKKLNESGILKISFPDDVVGLEDFEIKKGYLIQAFLPDEKKKVHCVFSGYIEERSIAGNVISLVGYDFIGYAKHRMIREDLKFENYTIKAIIEKVIEKLNEVSVLPFSLRKNDCEEIVSIEFKAFTSLYAILKELSKKVAALEIRHASEVDKRRSLEYLDISKQSGEIKEGIWADNANVQQRNSKVIAREWRDNFGNYCNYRRDNNGNVKENQSSIEEGLLFEKFEQNPEKMPDNLSEGDGLPKIIPEVSNAEIAQLQVGDRKQIRLIARLDRARFEYLGIIQETSLSSNSAGGMDFSVKIGEKIIEQKNVLDKTLANLATAVKKSVFSGGTAPAPTVDLSGYATSTAVAQALQAQNVKLAQKADSAFVAGVAQTAQTALNTANQAQQTASSKADAQHNHDDRYYTETEIDEKLRGKADANHTHNFPTTLPASDVPAWAKAPAKPSYTIDEISGLREALNNSSSSVASMDRIQFAYTTDLTSRNFRIASRHQLSNIPHGSGGHQVQVLWGDLVPEGGGHDGGWGLMFGPSDNPYLRMQGSATYLGRTDGHIFPQNWIELPNHKGLHWSYNSDFAQIYFRSNNNNDSSLDFKLGDDGTEQFRFLFNNNRRTFWNHDHSAFKQKMFVHAREEYGLRASVSLAIGDSDTGYNRESDGVFSQYSNGVKIQTFHQNAVPVVAEDLGHNVKIKKLTQAQYDALGAGRPSNVIYYITD